MYMIGAWLLRRRLSCRKGLKMRKYVVIVVILLVVITAAAGIGWVVRAKIKAAGKPTVVRVERPERGELIEFVSAPGEIEPKTKVEISAKVSARIVALPFDEGDRVTAGDPNADPPVPTSVIVRLDSKDLESRLKSAQASYAAQAAQINVEQAHIASQKANLVGLQASLKQGQKDLERQKELLESYDVSQATYDKTKLQVDELQSQLESAEHSLKAAELNIEVLEHNLEAADAGITQAKEALSYTTILSPIDGIVTRINAEVGEVVIYGTMNNPGTVIMEVADLSQMLVVAQVDEADVGKLEVGQKVAVHVDAFADHEFTGVVDSIALAHTLSFSRTKYFRTEILLQDVDRKLYEGLTAHVDIETRKHVNILKVPSQAVLGRQVDVLPLEVRDNSPYVDKAKTYATVVYRCIDSKAVVTPVKIGPSNLTHTIILDGITENDRIVVGPYKVLENIGHNQKIQDERQAKAAEESDSGGPQADANKPDDTNEPDSD